MDKSEYENLQRDLEENIQLLEKRIKEDELTLANLKHRLQELNNQKNKRALYISSSEILTLIYEHSGKESNMSTIKRWADQGFLGEVVDEREEFWALKTKQGKKRFLYPKNQVFKFLYEKQLLRPRFHVLDRVRIYVPDLVHHGQIAVVVKNILLGDGFIYTLQLEDTFKILDGIPESHLISFQESFRSEEF